MLLVWLIVMIHIHKEGKGKLGMITKVMELGCYETGYAYLITKNSFRSPEDSECERVNNELIPCQNPWSFICGYVSVPSTHPFNRVDHMDSLDDNNILYSIESCIDVHGGLTFGGTIQLLSIAHKDQKVVDFLQKYGNIITDSTWWFGFDFAHFSDTLSIGEANSKKECDRLYKQLKMVEEHGYTRYCAHLSL